MKTKYILPLFLFFSTFLVMPSMAQGYQVPTRELVESLLKQLDECKKDLAQAEKEIGIMENNPGQYSLETYLFTKKYIKELKGCVKYSRGKLDTLRKDYPGWFNSPSAFSDIRMHWPRINTPKEIEEALARIDALVAKAVAQFELLEEPKD